MSLSEPGKKPRLSVVVPVYFNELNLPHLFPRLAAAAAGDPGVDFEFLFVDDGSGDGSLAILRDQADRDPRVRIVKLSRNFGSFTACLAGLSHATGDAAVIISADLQDPPELITDMIARWRSGFKVVMAARESRDEPWLQRLLASTYYGLLRRYALPDMPSGGFDFVLIDRKVIDVITAIQEKNTSLMGLILWTGFRRTVIPYERRAREHGRSMWTLRRKIKYFIDSFVAFSYAPIRFVQYLGIAVSLGGFGYALFIAYHRIAYGFPVPGLSALIIITLVLGGVQLLTLGTLGEYLWRSVDETKRRPVFIVDEVIPALPRRGREP